MITLKIWPTERELMLSLQEFVAAVEVERSNDLMEMLKTATHGVTISISKVKKEPHQIPRELLSQVVQSVC
jgi:hypothetical protein